MLTFLASPKSFVGHVGEIQRRAIRSWMRISPNVRVILYGRSGGVAEVARDLGISYVPDIDSTAGGVPYFDAVAQHASRTETSGLHAYINCDIMLPPDFISRIGPAKMSRFLLLGQRVDLGRDVEFSFEANDWCDRLTHLETAGMAVLHGPTGMDYFVFPRGMWNGLRPLVIGRAGYDAALLAFCLRRRIPVVDATWVVPAIHQFHDYGHVNGGLREAHFGADAEFNRRTHDLRRSPPDIADADFVIHRNQVATAGCRGDRLRRAEIILRYQLKLKLLSYAVRAGWRLRERVGCSRSIAPSLPELISSWRTSYVAQ